MVTQLNYELYLFLHFESWMYWLLVWDHLQSRTYLVALHTHTHTSTQKVTHRGIKWHTMPLTLMSTPLSINSWTTGRCPPRLTAMSAVSPYCKMEEYVYSQMINLVGHLNCWQTNSTRTLNHERSAVIIVKIPLCGQMNTYIDTNTHTYTQHTQVHALAHMHTHRYMLLHTHTHTNKPNPGGTQQI